MSWSPELYIGSMRPWPDSVQVIRSQTDESRWYVLEEVCVPHGEWERISQTQEAREMHCICGHYLGTDKRGSIPFDYEILFEMPRYCPDCGCRITSKGKAVDE